jgi:hypothetical protein
MMRLPISLALLLAPSPASKGPANSRNPRDETVTLV